MIFEQLFDTKSSTYTYIISSGKGREALIIDPVIEHTDEYIKVLKNLELKLVKVIDTHIHADHVTGLNELNKRTNCTRIMGEKSKSEVIDLKIKDSEKINVENIELKAIYTPGHTDCSYSYLMNDRVFTGDTLLINGTGRTDFQNGSAEDAYESLFNKYMKWTWGSFVTSGWSLKNLPGFSSANAVETISKVKNKIIFLILNTLFSLKVWIFYKLVWKLAA